MPPTSTFNLDRLYPKLVHLLLDPVLVVDESGIIVFISDACEQVFGYRPAEMRGTRILDYLHPDDLDRTLAAARRVMAGAPHIDFENRYVHKDGHAISILWSARWLEEERVRIAVARDVTALRRSDQTRDALYRISQSAHAAESLRALCEEIHRVIGDLFSTNDLYLAFYDDKNEVVSYPYFSTDREQAWVDGPLQENSAMAEVIRTGQALLARSDSDRPGLGRTGPVEQEAASWLGVPLESRGRILGAVVIESRSSAEHYSTEDRDLLEFVATQLATAVERKRVEEDLRFLAHHDSLTGLTNRSLFYDRLETALRAARRSGEILALLYLDLDGFKQINDSRGHELGDLMLREVARRLEANTREADTVARMGGDEFTVLLTGLSGAPSAQSTLLKLRETLAAPMVLCGESFTMRASIGLALYPEDGESAEQLLRRADAGMYAMKRQR
ncbi:diguanylate cyclase (GGDEF domain) with PAS/PAC sensor [Marinobacter santoriniensis NKSG1]|uniref:Diguanylate cyclase (GGDEF domain) with PAS/PAC sensor n=1 Tax=Marinobacter santoriniensis NKSG1 TaxID=1288826 RepID=M7D294_9GAMM|nr:sensor domain-containing diguanylate cyclase [Marinobacter santoriniensis]EMP54863.1 diguanylate cyclase (GGDEF domain) with PAS/PAC sensor [Marinobacter santoriniensis NKSG1]